MSESTGLVLLTGGITAANEVVFAPLSGNGTPWKSFNWRILPATGILALALSGVDQISPRMGKGIALIALVTALLTPFGNTGSPAQNAAKALGYST